MEIAVPIMALGGLYMFSNADENESRETFENNTTLAKSRAKYLPNTNIQHKKYPVATGISELKENTRYYSNGQSSKHFNASTYQPSEGNEPFVSLTGNVMESQDFKHNNMVPFFGSKITQSGIDKNHSLLDNMAGRGSHYIHKEERAPLFKPQQNMGWAHGTPNATDFVKSRINPSMRMANTKPWEEVRVGPGLNQKDGVKGTGGFNAGMEARDRWIAKTVDQLRAKTNPKLTYEGQILNPVRSVQNRGEIGKVEQYKPDTYYLNTPERYFTTTGQRKAQRAQGEYIMKEENREETSTEYFGTGQDAQGSQTYIKGDYRPSMRPELDPNVKHIMNPRLVGQQATSGDHSINGYRSSVRMNNKTLTAERQPEYGIMGSIVRAITAPVMDVLRPSRKENVIGNLRPSGNAGNREIGAGVVYNPAEKARTTYREMSEVNTYGYGHSANGARQQGGYQVTKPSNVSQQRDDTSVYHVRPAGSLSGTKNTRLYDNAYNMRLVDRSTISKGRHPVPEGQKVFNGEQQIRVLKNDSDRVNIRQHVPERVSGRSSSIEHTGMHTMKNEYRQDIQSERNTSEILDAFRKNPYTKSLHSAV
jgi:hypothetical protein